MPSLLVALVTATQVAAPDAPLGSRIPNPNPLFSEQPAMASEIESFQVGQRMGACLVKADPKTSMAFVMAEPNSDKSGAALKGLQRHMSRCLTNSAVGTNLYGIISLKTSPKLLRGTIAEALYRLQFRNAAIPTNVQVLVAPIFSAVTQDSDDRERAIAYEFAQCVTGANPLAVRLIALSSVGSAEEREAYSKLTPFMSSCLNKGTTLKTDRLTFRFVLAEALYRWSLSSAQLASQERPH